LAGFLTFLGFLAAVYLGVLAALYFMQRSLLYLPDQTRPTPVAFGVPEMAAVTLTTEDGLSLLAWWTPPRETGGPVLVYFHGNGGHIGYRGLKIRPYLDRGFGVLLVAWRGYSGNGGSPTEAGLYADGRAALRFLESRGIAVGQRVFYGESLGSGPAVELAAEGAAGALVLEAPFTSIADMAASQFPIFPARRLVRDRFDSIAKIGLVAVPLLIVHGERDGIVPARMGRALLAAANPPKEGVFLPRAGHNDLYDHGAAAHVLRFIDRLCAKRDIFSIKFRSDRRKHL